jgi:hypothetical protein
MNGTFSYLMASSYHHRVSFATKFLHSKICKSDLDPAVAVKSPLSPANFVWIEGCVQICQLSS